MVKENLVEIREAKGVGAMALGTEIDSLDVRAMHKTKGEVSIQKLRNKIISAVSDVLLVRIDEGELESRKLMNINNARLLHTEDTMWREGIRIRHELTSEGEKITLPRGWIWQDADGKLIGCIYKQNDSEGHKVFVHRDIADNPHGSSVLISAMRKKINKLVPKPKSKK